MDLNLEKLNFRDIIEHQKDFKENYRKKDVIDYDFKIVSFKLGKEYFGIDIMNVKEIKKIEAREITWVPNTLNFVKGVFNLRGEIISIIDLAVMFNLVDDRKYNKNDILSLIVIKLDELKLGLVVDQIQRVLPLRKADIQPPSPLLGSINERFIKGVIELNQRLYVIFDTDAIFSDKTASKKEVLQQSSGLSDDYFLHFCNQLEELNSIHINDFNKTAFKKLFTSFIEENKIKDLPTLDKVTAKNILNNFLSKYTDTFWDKDYVDKFSNLIGKELSAICSDEVRILVLGCGTGYEAFSVYFVIDKIFEEIEIKMVAADSNLSAITRASGLECDKSEIPSWIDVNKYFISAKEGLYKVKKEINDKIYFEFHDAKNIASYNRRFDIVIARDLSLYFANSEYDNFISEVSTKIVENGLLVLGDNELLGRSEILTKLNSNDITVYKKIKG